MVIDEKIEENQFLKAIFKQKFNWDCGIACIIMCLNLMGKQFKVKEVYEFFNLCKE